MIQGQHIAADQIPHEDAVNRTIVVDLAERRAHAQRRLVIEYLSELPRDEALIICGAFLDAAGAGMPEYAHELVTQGEADLWADCAAPHELRAAFKAIMPRLIADAPLYGERTRKALLVDLWNTLPAQDRARFLQSVDPSGEFVGKGKRG